MVLTKEKIYCSAVVKILLTTWSENKSLKISQRDCVIVEPEEKIYKLWNTNLVTENLETREVKINITGNDDMSNIYFRYGRRNDVIMIQKTKNRLNAFLDYYGFDRLEVHNSQKEFCVKYHDKALKVSSDSWYKLDFDTKELIKC